MCCRQSTLVTNCNSGENTPFSSLRMTRRCRERRSSTTLKQPYALVASPPIAIRATAFVSAQRHRRQQRGLKTRRFERSDGGVATLTRTISGWIRVIWRVSRADWRQRKRRVLFINSMRKPLSIVEEVPYTLCEYTMVWCNLSPRGASSRPLGSPTILCVSLASVWGVWIGIHTSRDECPRRMNRCTPPAPDPCALRQQTNCLRSCTVVKWSLANGKRI